VKEAMMTLWKQSASKVPAKAIASLKKQQYPYLAFFLKKPQNLNSVRMVGIPLFSEGI
jgi:hypothetical protein